MADGDKKLTDVTLDEFIDALNKKQEDGLPVLPILGSVGPWIKLVHTIGLPWAIIIGGGFILIPKLNALHIATQEAGAVVKRAVEGSAEERRSELAEIKSGQKEITHAVEARAADAKVE